MPILLHLTSHKNIQKILKSGIKGVSNTINCGNEQKSTYEHLNKSVYCMPVLQNYYISHQWLRELKRGSQKNFVGIYFRVASEELVYVGRYNQPHNKVTIERGIKLIMDAFEPQGYEIIIPRSIKSNEIHKVRHLPQFLGWRYYPDAHSHKPTCACPVCIPVGSIKSKRLRERLQPPEKSQNYQALIEQLEQAIARSFIIDTLYKIHSIVHGGNKRRAADLEFLIEHPSNEVIEALADTLGAYQGKDAINMLLKLCIHQHDECRRASAWSLLEILKKEAFVYLNEFKEDKVISQVLKDYINDNGIELGTT